MAYSLNNFFIVFLSIHGRIKTSHRSKFVFFSLETKQPNLPVKCTFGSLYYFPRLPFTFENCKGNQVFFSLDNIFQFLHKQLTFSFP